MLNKAQEVHAGLFTLLINIGVVLFFEVFLSVYCSFHFISYIAFAELGKEGPIIKLAQGPTYCKSAPVLFHRKRYCEAEEKRSFRQPFPNGFVFERQFRVKTFSIGPISSVFFFFASLSVDKVVTVRESLKTWENFLAACTRRGLSNVEQSCAMRSLNEMDAPYEMFFF